MKQDGKQIQKEKLTRSQIARRWLIFWTLFIGIGAVGGAVMMFCDPSGKIMGMDALLPYFGVLPFADILFQNFLFPGFALLIVNGLSNLTAAVLLLKKKKIGVVLGGVFGVTLMLWICIQFVIFPLNFMSTIYFVFGFCQAIVGYLTWFFGKQEELSAQSATCSDGQSENRSKKTTMKTAKLIPVGILLLFFVGLAILLIGCSQEGFNGSRVKNPDSYLLDIDSMNGTDLHTLELNEGDVLKIHFETVRGSMYMDIKAPNGTTVYSGNGKELTDFTVNIQESGVYTVVVEAKRAKGIVEVKLDK